MKKESKGNYGKGKLGRESVIALLELQALTAGSMKRAFIHKQTAFLKEEIRRQEDSGERKRLSMILHEKKLRLDMENHINGHGWQSGFCSEWLVKVGNYFQSIGE